MSYHFLGSLPVFLATEENIQLPQAGAEAVHSSQLSIVSLILSSGPVVQGVLILLVLMSLKTWAIIWAKFGQMRKAQSQSQKFNDVFWSSNNLSQMEETSQKLSNSPVAKVFSAGLRELKEIVRLQKENETGGGYLESVDRALRRAKAEEITRIEKGTTFLATTASAAPFIGLFGTVWGIMNAFIGLSSVKSSSIQAVAPGISEALIATAIGLAAAIPAAIGYNYFAQQIKVQARDMDMFSSRFLNIAKMHFVK